MQEFITYEPVIFGFVVNIDNPRILSDTKVNIIEGIRRMESDDKAYIYHPNNLEIPRWPGGAVGLISNYKHLDFFKLGDALEQTVALLAREDEDSKKHLIYVTDNEKEDLEWNMQKAFFRDVHTNCNCEYIFCDLGEKIFTHKIQSYAPKDRCRHYHINPATLRNLISNCLQQNDQSAFYSSLDMIELRLDYKEKYGRNKDCERVQLEEDFSDGEPEHQFTVL